MNNMKNANFSIKIRTLTIILIQLITTLSLQSHGQNNVVKCIEGLGMFDQNNEFQIDPTFKNYQLIISPKGGSLNVGRNLRDRLFPDANNPQFTEDNKKYYLFTSNPLPFDTALWVVKYFIDDEIAKVYSASIRGDRSKPFPVGTALCPR